MTRSSTEVEYRTLVDTTSDSFGYDGFLRI